MDNGQARHDMVNRVKEIKESLYGLQRELAAIREECDHLPELAFNAIREVKLICTVCGEDIGYPDRTHLNQFLSV